MAVRPLPPAPSSLTLALSAFATLGLYQAGRSLRKVHLGALPDWYHAQGPVQVGHATPLPLEFQFADVPLMVCAPVLPDFQRIAQPLPRVLGREAAGFLLRAAPRGPPEAPR